MRSETMAWLFSLGDIHTEVLEGGYKSYRNHILSSLSEKRKMIILGGMTGSGKTHILRYFKINNYQVIDLEGKIDRRVADDQDRHEALRARSMKRRTRSGSNPGAGKWSV